ncbi:MAG: hypothetical protein HOH74_30440, partial [Gemmatimonadetes bacterium]|nr:hypothetical protein [Gemmatimonadota bacterium]
DDLTIIERLTAIFAIGYRRHLELAAAEERARQAELQGAVERVRSAAMAMATSDSMPGVVSLLFQEMRRLGVDTPRAAINFIDEESGQIEEWFAGALGLQELDWSQVAAAVSVTPEAVICRNRHVSQAHERPSWEAETVLGAWRQGQVATRETTFVREKLLQAWKDQGTTGTPEQLQTAAAAIAGDWQDTHVPFKYGTIGFYERVPMERNIDIVRALAGALELGYLRFLDFQDLERQNRELGVERGLERLRTSVAAMETSDGLEGLRDQLQQELQTLGVPCEQVGINTYDAKTQRISFTGDAVARCDVERRVFFPPGNDTTFSIDVMPSFAEWVDHFSRTQTYVRQRSGKATGIDLQGLTASGAVNDAEAKALGEKWSSTLDRWIVDAFFEHGSLAMNRPAPEPFSDGDVRLLERFTEVFALGYRRHLDLQAAEARTRDAEVERALERVRTAVAAMDNSGLVEQLVAVVKKELQGLQVPCRDVAIVTYDAEQKQLRGSHSGVGNIVEVATDQWPPFPEWEQHWKRRQTWVRQHDRPHQMELVAAMREAGMLVAGDVEDYVDDGRWVIDTFFEQGCLSMNKPSPERFTDDDIHLLERFTEVFALGYRRHLDLAAAEQRVRDAELERALEHVRTVVSGMESADEYGRVVDVLRDELRTVGINCDQVGINIIDGDAATMRTEWNSEVEVAVALPADAESSAEIVEGSAPTANPLIEHWRNGTIWSRARSETTPGVLGWVVDVPFEFGTLAMNRGQSDAEAQPFDDDEITVLQGFANVVSLGYTRFRDFEQLEQQNRQLTIERAVERVRAEAMAMQQSGDAYRIVAALWEGLT